MESIEKLLDKVEDGDSPLEKFLEFFEQDVLLICKAQTQLVEAEQKCTAPDLARWREYRINKRAFHHSYTDHPRVTKGAISPGCLETYRRSSLPWSDCRR